MARPREFDDEAVMDAAIQRFWDRGFEATSITDLVGSTGVTAGSLYNAYGDKRGLFRTALDRYVERSIGARMDRCEALPPLDSIRAFFGDIVERSLRDPEHKGCMVVNSALEMAPHDPEMRETISAVLVRLECFFRERVAAGQADATIAGAMPAEDLARHLLGVVMGVRVLARVRPERALLEGVVGPALALLEGTTAGRPPAAVE